MASRKMMSSSKKTIKRTRIILLIGIGIENIKAKIFLTDLTFLTPKPTYHTINQIYDIFGTSFMKYLWLRYKMKATESVQITLQLLKYVMYTGVTFPNDPYFMTLVASTPKYLIDVILLQIHCSHGLNLRVTNGFFLQI